MEKSFARLAGFEHEAELLAGYDDLVECVGTGNELTPEATYTNTVLKLDSGTYGQVDGTESFMDNIKRGATKVYEWIKALIKSIKEWLFGKPKREAAVVEKEFVDVSAALDIIMKEPEKVIQGEVISSVTNSHIPEPIKNEVKKNLQRISSEERKTISDAEVTPPNVDDKQEKIIKEMAERLSTRLESVSKNLDEINRVDPDQIVSKELKIDQFLRLYSKNNVTLSDNLLKTSNSNTIASAAAQVVSTAKKFDEALAEAIVQLERMNSKGPFVVENEESRQVSRAGRVVRELGEATNKMRDLVTTLDSQLNKTASKLESMVLRSKLVAAMKHSSEASANYIQMAIDELMKA